MAEEWKDSNSRAESPFGVGLGPMGPEEKDYLVKKGYLKEDSDGNLYGEPPTLIDETTDEVSEEREVVESQERPEGQVLFHVGDVSVRSVTVHMMGDSPKGSPGPDHTDPHPNDESEEETEFLLSASTLLTRYTEMGKDGENGDENKENIEIGIEAIEDEGGEEMVYSTPETSFCPTTPPQSDLELSDRQPPIDEESEREMSFYDSYHSPLSRSRPPQMTNNSAELESGEELDDTISQMEKLLALADAQEFEENERLESERGQIALNRMEELIPDEPEPELGEEKPTECGHVELPLPPTPPPPAAQKTEFKTPFAKPRSAKKVVRSPTSGFGVRTSPPTTFSPRRESPRKLTSQSPSNPFNALSSTPKSTAKHCVNSMVSSPVSTIHGSPTPGGKGKGVVKNVKGIPFLIRPSGTGIPFPSGVSGVRTPSAMVVNRGYKLLAGVPVSSPVARYIYSTPTPPMVKRAIKTECQSAPQDKKSQPLRLGLGPAVAGLSSIPRAITSSAIPRFGVRDCGSTGKLTEMGYSQRVNARSMSRDGFGFKRMSEKEMKPVKYQGSAQVSCPIRTVNQDPRTPVSTPKVDVVKARVEEHFIAQRHTGARNANTNESIVQHASVDKKFVPTRILVPPKK